MRSTRISETELGGGMRAEFRRVFSWGGLVGLDGRGEKKAS
jgi:hypothetical protein